MRPEETRRQSGLASPRWPGIYISCATESASIVRVARERAKVGTVVCSEGGGALKTRRLGRVKRRCDVYLAFCEIVRFGVVVGRRWSPAAWERLPQTRKAIVFAERMHAGQERSDGSPFVLHPMEVGSLLYYAGAPDHVIAAGVMHDLIEKAGVSVADIRTQFGARIAGLVRAVSDDDGTKGVYATQGRASTSGRRGRGRGAESVCG